MQDRQRFHGESETLVVDDMDDLEVMRKLMGYIFGVGVSKGA